MNGGDSAEAKRSATATPARGPARVGYSILIIGARGPARIVYSAGIIAAVVMSTSSYTTVYMSPIFGVAIPSTVGALFFGYFVWWLLRKHPERPANPFWTKWNIESNYARQGVLAVGGLICAAFVAYGTHEAIRTVGLYLGGATHPVEATVCNKRMYYGKRPCREFATFRVEDGQVVEICVRPSFRADLIDSELARDEHVRVIIQSNQVSDTVVRIIRVKTPDF